MLSGRRLSLVAATLVALSALSPTPARAQWGAGVPDGSFRYTCAPAATYVSGGILYSQCSPKKGAMVATKLEYRYCLPASISNQNGQLACPIDTARKAADEAKAAQQKAAADARKARVAQALPAFRSASVIVLGEDASGSDADNWLYDGDKAGFAADFADGVEFSEAVAFLKARIARPEGAADRASAINNAYYEVYARPATPVEQAGRDAAVRAGKAWYATIVLGEIDRQRKDPALRTALLHQSYKRAMGREARAGDLSYWMPRPEHARQLIAANRAWLYSGAGATDLAETVGRALVAKGKAASDANVKKLMIAVTPDRAIYDDMLGYKYASLIAGLN